MIITIDDDLIHVNLVNLTYENNIEVGQYIVNRWSSLTTENNEMKLTLHLKRSIQSIFMVTFVPTILMNVINQVIYHDIFQTLLIIMIHSYKGQHLLKYRKHFVQKKLKFVFWIPATLGLLTMAAISLYVIGKGHAVDR